jgi:hypothetical protein
MPGSSAKTLQLDEEILIRRKSPQIIIKWNRTRREIKIQGATFQNSKGHLFIRQDENKLTGELLKNL